MRISRSIVAILGGLLMIVSTMSTRAAAPELAPLNLRPSQANQPISLRDRLIAGLQARLKTEVEFCDKVTMKVLLGHLPQRIVDETFFWARQRAQRNPVGPNHRPIIYFMPAMRMRAERLHISL